MVKLIKIKILSGIPGCGKSTWARDFISKNPDTKRINRDDLRKMFDDSRFSDGNESFVNKVKLSLIKIGIDFNKDMVIDDTHCYVGYLGWLIDEIRDYAANENKPIFIELIDFDVDVDICVTRNDIRDIKLEKSAIYYMAKEKKEIDISKLNIDLYIIVK